MISILVAIAVVAVLAIVVAVVLGSRSSGRRSQLTHLREFTHEDVHALGEEITRTGAHPEGALDLARARECEQRAHAELHSATRPEHITRVTSALAEGHHAVRCARARVEERDPPEPRALCFFNPGHGPSVSDVAFASIAGPVPACEACALAVDHGAEPTARTVIVDGQSVPHWHAAEFLRPWAEGFFGPTGHAS